MHVGSGASLTEIQQLYEARLSDFVRTAAAICGSREAGRDATHDAFVSALRNRQRFRGEGTVEAWLWAAVVNTALKHRARRRDSPVADPLAGSEPASRNGHAGDLAHVRIVVAQLPERQRLVLFLRYYADLDYEQIAVALGISAAPSAPPCTPPTRPSAPRSRRKHPMTERDPLVAEGLERLLPLAIEEGDWPRVLRDAAAVRRPRRRRYVVIALAAVALAVLAPLTALAVSKGWWFLEHEAPKPVTPVSVIATGRWNGIPWVLTAYLSDTDGVCLAMTPQSSDRNAGGGAMSCDAIDGVTSPAPPKRFTPHRISYLSGSSGGKLPGWVAGPVVDTAREVDILFRNAPTIRVATIPAPESLRSRIRFYLAELPAGRATISEVIGRDGRGAVVARLHVPLPSFADPRFTMKNHGKQVTLSAAMKARLRAAHRVGWVRLLATRDGRNFYRFGSCFGVGPAGDPSAFPATAGPAAFGELLCGNQFPSPQRPLLDASAYRRGELVRLGGFAGDAVKIIELVDRHGRGLGRAPVVANVYSAARVPRGVVALVAVGARGKRLARCSPAAC